MKHSVYLSMCANANKTVMCHAQNRSDCAKLNHHVISPHAKYYTEYRIYRDQANNS